MKSSLNNFPVYRKYVGVDTWFKIVNEKEFLEIKRIGSKYVLHHVHANQFPEMQLIQDMIALYENRWEEIEGEVFVLEMKKVD